MHNFTIPSVLKAWIDQILRVGRTMKSTPAGKEGMLRDRPVFIGVASGGVFTGERANQPDFLTPYLSLVLNSIGLKTLQFLSVQATGFMDPERIALVREKALATIDLAVVRELQEVDSWPAVSQEVPVNCISMSALLWGVALSILRACHSFSHTAS